MYPTGTRRPGRPERSLAFVPGHSLHEPLPGRRLPRSPASAVGRLLGPSGGPGNKRRPQASRGSLPTLAGDTAPNAPAWALGRGQRARMASWLLGSARTRCSACWRPLARPRRCPTIQARRDELPLPWSSLRGMCPGPRHPPAAPLQGKPPRPGTARAASDVSGSASCGLTTTTTPSRQQLWGGQALTHVLGQPGCREPRAQRSLCRSVTPQRRESNCTAANARFDSHPRPAHRRLPNSSGDSNQMSIALDYVSENTEK